VPDSAALAFDWQFLCTGLVDLFVHTAGTSAAIASLTPMLSAMNALLFCALNESASSPDCVSSAEP